MQSKNTMEIAGNLKYVRKEAASKIFVGHPIRRRMEKRLRKYSLESLVQKIVTSFKRNVVVITQKNTKTQHNSIYLIDIQPQSIRLQKGDLPQKACG